INNIKKIKEKVNPLYSAIQINLEKQDNSTIGFINQLKHDFDLIIGLGGLNKTNRFFLYQTQIDILQDPQNSRLKNKIDFIHHFNSGLNQILCNYAKEKRVSFLFTLNFLSGKTFHKAKEIARINQNLKFARKYEIPIIINYIINTPIQIKTTEKLLSIIDIFETSCEQKTNSFNIFENKIKENQIKRTNNYIADGLIIN
ncbi:MAG: hypothetical protein KC550_02990, partial [Nanoarchaeota archaeon]|nr:hypothetical protein [Nanoarchaeota archaeon]